MGPVAAFDDKSGAHRGELVFERERTEAASDFAFDVLVFRVAAARLTAFAKATAVRRSFTRRRKPRATVRQRALHPLQKLFRLREASLLQILVLQPPEAVKIELRRRESFALHVFGRRGKGRLVRADRLVPEA